MHRICISIFFFFFDIARHAFAGVLPSFRFSVVYLCIVVISFTISCILGTFLILPLQFYTILVERNSSSRNKRKEERNVYYRYSIFELARQICRVLHLEFGSHRWQTGLTCISSNTWKGSAALNKENGSLFDRAHVPLTYSDALFAGTLQFKTAAIEQPV